MVKHLHLILLFLLTIAWGGQKTDAQTYNYLVFEQNGLYYLVYDGSRAEIIEGALGAYYLEHQGDLAGWDYNANHEILPGYKGNVTVPAEVTYQGKSYPVSNVSGLSNNPYLTSLTIDAALTSLNLQHVEALTSLTLNNTSQMISVYLSVTGLTTFKIPATVTSANLSYNYSMKSVTVASGNTNYTSVNGMLTNKPRNDYDGWNVLYVPEGFEGKLVLPEGITGCASLAYCKKITEVVIPSTLQTYALTRMLENTEGIRVTIGNDNANMAIVDNEFITNKAKDSIIYILPSKAVTLTIPEGIKHGSFDGLANFHYWQQYDSETGQSYTDYNKVVLEGSRPNVKTINLPSTFELPDYPLLNALRRAYELQAINVAAGNPNLAGVDGILMDKKKAKLMAVPLNHAATTVPEGTSVICEYAFCNNRNLTNITIPSTVKTIESGAFSECRKLEKASLPQNVNMGGMVFTHCVSLQHVNLPAIDVLPIGTFYECESLTSVDIPEQVARIGSNAFFGCKSLTEINLPAQLTEIQDYAFSNCTKLQSITLPNTLTTLGNGVFSGDSCLQSLTIPASVTSIGAQLTRGCPLIEKITVDPNNKYYCDQDGVVFTANKQTLVYCPSERKGTYDVPQGTIEIKGWAFYPSELTGITFPDGLQRVGNYAFRNAYGIKTFDFPASVTNIDYDWFGLDNANTEQPERRFIFRTDSYLSAYSAIGSLPYNSRVYVHEKNFKNFSSYQADPQNKQLVVFCLNKPFAIGKSTSYLRGLRLKVVENDLTNMEKNLGNISVNQQNDQKTLKNMQQLSDGTWYVQGLETNQNYDINIGYKVKGSDENMTISGFKTNKIKASRSYTATQTTATISNAYIYNAEDTTAVAVKYEMRVADKTYDLTDLPNHRYSEPIYLTNLAPGTSYPIDFTVTYDDGEKAIDSKSLSTQSFNPQGIDYVLSPTTLRLNFSYTEIDAVPDSIAIILYRENNWSQRDTLYATVTRPVFTGLTPGTQYTNDGVYFVTNGKMTTRVYFNNFYNFETPKLTLATEQPKIPALGRAFVEATINTGDDEARVGFEWRKYDAPAEMKSMEAYGVVYDGKAQGLLADLSTSNYYKVRAFYDDAKGTRYYAQNGPNNDGWITFDPSEVSHMEAVVHTNGNPSPTNTTVVLLGVVLQGSDNIIEQGFEYWKKTTDKEGNITNSRVLRAPAESERHTIAVNGQGISVEITDLTPGTDYAYRAYAKTSKGMVYGEERTFRTNGEQPSAIEDVSIQMDVPRYDAWYTLDGVKLDKRPTKKGLYIKNGKKIVIK